MEPTFQNTLPRYYVAENLIKQAGAELGQAQLKLEFGFTPIKLY